MTGRRRFLMDTGAWGLGIAAGGARAGTTDIQPSVPPLAAAGESPRVMEAPAAALPAVTLLSMRHAGGHESLGIRFDDGVFDVAQAAVLLCFQAPLTITQMLPEGSRPQIQPVLP